MTMRLSQFQQNLDKHGLAGAILFQSRDIYYYTGVASPAYLAVRPDEVRLFVRSGWGYAAEQSGLGSIGLSPKGGLREICLDFFAGPGRGEKIGTELPLMNMAQARALQEALGSRMLADATPLVFAQRMIKEPGEAGLIEKAAQAGRAGHQAAIQLLEQGGPVTELELAAAVEHAQRLAGHEGHTFFRKPDMFMSRGPVASGPNLTVDTGVVYTITGVGQSPALPVGPSGREIQPGELVSVDIPPCVGGYHSDQTRMYCLGNPDPRALDLYTRLEEVHDHLIDRIKPGLTCSEAFGLAMSKAAKLGIADYLGLMPGGVKAHFIGHGLGLEITEPPLLDRDSDAPLKAGMVFTLEIHAFDPPGVMVKLEDTVHLTEQGCRLLTMANRDISVVIS